jgi:hypothetical protein
MVRRRPPRSRVARWILCGGQGSGPAGMYVGDGWVVYICTHIYIYINIYLYVICMYMCVCALRKWPCRYVGGGGGGGGGGDGAAATGGGGGGGGGCPPISLILAHASLSPP